MKDADERDLKKMVAKDDPQAPELSTDAYSAGSMPMRVRFNPTSINCNELYCVDQPDVLFEPQGVAYVVSAAGVAERLAIPDPKAVAPLFDTMEA